MTPDRNEPQLTALQLASVLPKNPRFREWVAIVSGQEGIRDEHATEWIRFLCGIASRRELATNAEAQRRFHQLIRKPYLAWLGQLESAT